MVSINVKITAPNLETIRKQMSSLADMIEKPGHKYMGRLGDAVLEDIDKRFMTRGYGTWKALAPATILHKKHDFVLVETGAMISSTTMTVLTDNQVSVDVPYGGKNRSPKVPYFHQHGTSRMPPRKLIEKTPQLNAALELAIIVWVKDMFLSLKKVM